MEKEAGKRAGRFQCLPLLALMMTLIRLPARAYEYFNLAGLAETSGAADGTNTTARFNAPVSLARDAGGNIYVADYFNSTIRRVAPVGTNWVVSTVAGLAGSFGSADGTNSDARFNSPTGVAVDGAGNVFVADYFNHIIRKIAPQGTNWVVTTIAGSPVVFGANDGTNSDARFYYPRSLVVDTGGNVLVADTGNSTIRQIVPMGANWVTRTIAGLAQSHGSSDGTNSEARFYWPAGVAARENAIFVADYANDTIRQLVPAGTNWMVRTIAGKAADYGSADGTNGEARFFAPTGVAVDTDGNVYVADSRNDSLRKLTPAGTNWIVTTIGGQAGNPGSNNGTNTGALFNQPQGIAVDGAGDLYVADTENHVIRKGRYVASQIDLPPVFQGVVQSNLSVVLTWSATIGRSYQLQFKTNLVQTNWINLGGVRMATDPTMSATDPIGPAPLRFYRVALLP